MLWPGGQGAALAEAGVYHRGRKPGEAAGAAAKRRVQKAHDRGQPAPMRRAGVHCYGGKAAGLERVPPGDGQSEN